MASFWLKVTRIGFGGLGKISPRAAGRLAFFLFCRTPSRKPKGEKAAAVLASGRARLSGAQHAMVTVPGGEIATYRLTTGLKAPKILVVHGWGSRAEYLAELGSGLQAHGADVVLMDLPGHGRSYGRALNIAMAAEAIVGVEREQGPFDAVVAHSLGGLSVMAAVGGLFRHVPPLMAHRLVLIGAPSEVGEVFADFSAMIGLDAASRAALLDRAAEVGGRPIGDFDMSNVARRAKRPMLVVHAEDDKEVGPHHARRYGGIGSHIDFHWANGYGHRRIVSAPDVTAEIARFLMIRQYQTPLATV
ncbi:alpha/beta fold hydrolase [Rhizobium halophytocola]|uniref:Pimeloyl-ACP methyl ester carboxylesterase n=1 Tax=Rhizobium halophytocola TaxID=735519 RepID=A0ABS4DZ37_9HYPH|nr:alpha/beta hydrolase [Rhizobium halophytocola]MBP1850956.1 pimeloyl-ACP methyl ester carboxylesterase [Rhizobium halophytocola]